jgi:hypothetical protein
MCMHARKRWVRRQGFQVGVVSQGLSLQPPSAIPAGAGSSSQHAIELNNEPSDALAPAPKLKAPMPPDPHPRAEDDLDDENDEVQYVPGSLATAIEASHVGDVVPRRRWRWTLEVDEEVNEEVDEEVDEEVGEEGNCGDRDSSG